MLHDGNEAVGTDGRINLYSDSVLSSTPEFLDFEMLLEPLEEKFYQPTVLIDRINSNLRASQMSNDKLA